MLEKIVVNQILIERCLNRMKEDSEAVYLAIDTNTEQWNEIIKLIYEKYPNLKGVVCIEDLISYLLYSIEENSLESGEQIVEYAELVGEIVAKFIRGVSKIRGGPVNEG